MGPLRTLLLVAVCTASLPATFARAQETTEAVEDLFHDLEVEGGDAGDQAAFALFTRGGYDERLHALLADRTGAAKRESKLCLLRALKYCGRSAPARAANLVAAALDDTNADVVNQAVATFSSLESDETYAAIGKLLDGLRWAAPESTGGKQARALVVVLERLRNPQRAVAVLIDVLGGRLHRALEQVVRETLERMTSQRFSSPAQWRAWFDRAQSLSLVEWRREVSKRRTEALRKVEGTAEELFARLLAALHDDPDRLLKELELGLNDETIPSVCRRAIQELGRLGRKEGGYAQRERAVALLRARLNKDRSPDFNEFKALVIVALGRTGDQALLPDVLEYLRHNAPRLRAAAATALAALRAPQAIGPLLEQLDEEDPELVEASIVALGEIRGNGLVAHDGVEPERVSTVLVRFSRGLLGANGKAGPSSAPLLARAAEALGKLPYEVLDDAGRVVELLRDLTSHGDTNVRFAAVTALGPLEHPAAFEVLSKRLDAEPEVHVRKAILDAMGQQALENTELAAAAVDALVPFLLNVSEEEGVLRRKSLQRLEEIAREPSLRGLEVLTQRLLVGRERGAGLELALPFLRAMPPFDTLPAPRSKELRDRYLQLLSLRGEAQLRSAPQAALVDYEAVLVARELLTTDAMTAETLPLFLGKGRALLGVLNKRPRDAFAIAEACLTTATRPGAELPPQRLEAVWTLALDALEQARAAEPERAADLFARLEPRLGAAPAVARQRYEALKDGS